MHVPSTLLNSISVNLLILRLSRYYFDVPTNIFQYVATSDNSKNIWSLDVELSKVDLISKAHSWAQRQTSLRKNNDFVAKHF